MPRDFGELLHTVPLLASVDISTVTTDSDVVFLTKHSRARVVVNFGLLNGNAVVYVMGCPDATPTTQTAIAAWRYRKSSAVGTDSMGDLTAGSAAGITMTDNTDDGKTMVIYVEGDELNNAGYPAFQVEVDPATAALVGMVALVEPRYPQSTQLSAVA